MKRLKIWLFILTLFIGALVSCNAVRTEVKESETVFKRLKPADTGIQFINSIEAQEDFDVFRYRNFYNGGGVGIGDFDNDGLPDIYLTSNMGENQLYHNLGNWKFEEIAKRAGVQGSKVWSTGVSVADVNADGWLDIYVCNAGDVSGGNRENELFINNGDLTFTDKAKFYGLNDNGFGTHAAFFDYDKDGDLDCYVLNNSYRPVSSLGYRNLRHLRDEFGGHKLYRNDNDHFSDISEETGIYGSVIGFGLGVTVGDVNQDGWSDLYVSNDFYERDYLYINNQKGGFEEKIEEYMGHISMFSMGADMADLNNDGYPEIFSTDMLPERDDRLKTLIAFETFDVYQLRLKNGYYHQFMRNMFHLNNRNGSFVEIGELAGVAATDWSWGALICDFDNDQYKEIFVSNGIYKDVINQDFVEYLGSTEQMKAAIEGKKVDFRHFVDEMPSNKLSNYLFERQDDLRYENRSAYYGLDEPSFSNGAAYGDLDNDGDLDLIVNNVNQELFVYKNQTRERFSNKHFLALTFKGYDKNTFGLGATVRAFSGTQILSFDNMPIRGFQSSMDYKMVIGLGESLVIDSLSIEWPDQRIEVMRTVKADQTIMVDHANARQKDAKKKNYTKPLLLALDNQDLRHKENNFNDFDRDRLQYHMLSTQGPAFAVADLNTDGLDDVFMGGSVGSPGQLLIQKGNERFLRVNTNVFDIDSLSEDTDAVFFDADGDKDFDLYVVTGGSEYIGQSTHNLDRLYINIGTPFMPSFKKSEFQIPDAYHSGSCVRPGDFDNDGDLDLFVGTRVIPGYYGLPGDQVLLMNDGKGNYKDGTIQSAPHLQDLGMVTDATWTDYDSDGFVDLIIVGEWMQPTIFKNNGNRLEKIQHVSGLENSNGWWNAIKAVDVDEDSDVDFVLGNNGYNSKFKPSEQSPISLYVNDFDRNGSQEPIFTVSLNGKEYPMALRQDIIKQMSSMKKKFVFYKDYAGKAITDIFDQGLIDKAMQLKFYQPQTCVMLNDGQGNFRLNSLPIEAQFAPVYGIEAIDLDNDKHLDLILGGNLYAVKPEIGRYDALHGLVLKGDGGGTFTSLSPGQSGLDVTGEVRHIKILNSKDGKLIVLVRNNDVSKILTIQK